jgi:hypothetical protein
MVIISEHKIDEENLDIYDLVVWCSKDELGEKVGEVLQNYDFYQKKITEEKIKYIVSGRENIYMNFIKNFI